MAQASDGLAALAQPYAGIRILDLTHRYGSYVGRLFADLGAEVIRIEPPGGGPDRRRAGTGDVTETARFVFFNAGKKSLVLDPDTPSGMAAFETLARGAAGILIERDGLLFDRAAGLRALAPRAVVTVVSPYGMTGPLADAPASDLVVQAAGGIAWMSGRIEEAPLALPFDQATMVASIYAATVTAIALVDAEATGNGHLVDVSAQECIAHSLQNAIQVWDLEGRVSVRGGEGTRDASENIFPCRDGFVFLAAPLALGTSFRSLVGFMNERGHPSGERFSEPRWQDREWRLTRQAREEFRAILTDFTKDLDRGTLTRAAIARRIVLAPVNRIRDVFDDPQLLHRGFFGTMPVAGRKVAFPGAPYRVEPPMWSTAPAPALGEGPAAAEVMAR